MGEEPRDIYREMLNRTWANMKRRHSPLYAFRDGTDPVAYQVFCGDDSEIIHGHCAKASPDREFPLYEDDIQAMRNLEPILCFMCDGLIAAKL